MKVTTMVNAPRKRNQIVSSRSYELKVGNTRTLGAVFEALGEMGVTYARIARLAHSRIEEFRTEARIEAVKNAQKIAAELAGAVDMKIDRALWIQDNGFYETSPAPVYQTRSVSMDNIYIRGVAEADTTSLDMQQITLVYNVTVKFGFAWFD
jgi:uncharacterized protein YggE